MRVSYKVLTISLVNPIDAQELAKFGDVVTGWAVLELTGTASVKMGQGGPEIPLVYGMTWDRQAFADGFFLFSPGGGTSVTLFVLLGEPGKLEIP